MENTGEDKTEFSDPQLRFHFDRVNKLPKDARNHIINVVDAMILFLEEKKPRP